MNIKVLYIRRYKKRVTQTISTKIGKIEAYFYHNSTYLIPISLLLTI